MDPENNTGQNPTTPDTETQATDSAPEPKTFSEDYVKTLRDEAKSWRQKLREAETLLAEKDNSQKLEAEERLKKNAEFEALATQYATERDEFKTKFEALQQELEAQKVNNLRQQIGAEFNLPPALAERLTGTTEDEIREDAKQLAESLPASPTRSQQTTTAIPSGASPVGETKEQKMQRIYGRGSTSPFRPKS